MLREIVFQYRCLLQYLLFNMKQAAFDMNLYEKNSFLNFLENLSVSL